MELLFLPFLCYPLAFLLLPSEEVEPARVEISHESTCRGCGYDLAGLAHGVDCPECGASEPSKREHHLKATYRRRPANLMHLLLTAFVWFLFAHVARDWIYYLQAWRISREEGFAFHGALVWCRIHGRAPIDSAESCASVGATISAIFAGAPSWKARVISLLVTLIAGALFYIGAGWAKI